MRKKISELFGGAELFDITGLTELYGPGTGIECSDHDCIHYWSDYYLMEILDPETLQTAARRRMGRDGHHHPVQGRLAADPLPHPRHHAHHPRMPCTCGSIMPRHSRIKGRSDDTIKFRGVNIYPSSIDTILSAVPGLGSEYQIHLTRDEAGRDHLRLVVERAEGVAAARSRSWRMRLDTRSRNSSWSRWTLNWSTTAACPARNARASGFSTAGFRTRSFDFETGPSRHQSI
jgi:phenylacetate-CoA ligase